MKSFHPFLHADGKLFVQIIYRNKSQKEHHKSGVVAYMCRLMWFSRPGQNNVLKMILNQQEIISKSNRHHTTLVPPRHHKFEHHSHLRSEPFLSRRRRVLSQNRNFWTTNSCCLDPSFPLRICCICGNAVEAGSRPNKKYILQKNSNISEMILKFYISKLTKERRLDLKKQENDVFEINL